MSCQCDRCCRGERDPEPEVEHPRDRLARLERDGILLSLYRRHLADHQRQPTRDEVSAMISDTDAEIERRDEAAWARFTDPDRRRDERRERA